MPTNSIDIYTVDPRTLSGPDLWRVYDERQALVIAKGQSAAFNDPLWVSFRDVREEVKRRITEENTCPQTN